MTGLRKKLQDKLRRKFKYETNTNRNRGTSLIKPNACVSHHSTVNHSKEYDLVTDMAIVMDHWDFQHAKERAIHLYLTQYKNPKNSDKFDKLSDLSASISFEELEMIYQIACEMKKETEEIYNAK